jgi:2-iminobutanoate/2-iminopropanoate deaminase
MSKHYIVEVEGVPAPPSPISNAVVVGNQCWISGQLSVSEDGTFISGTALEEATRAFAHVFRIAESAGFEVSVRSRPPCLVFADEIELKMLRR